MTILGADLSSNNPVFNFALAFQQGCRTTYIKLGGDNIPRYVSGSYAGRVDQARAAGLRVGHYWVTGGHDPEAAAAFFVRNLRNVQPGDYFVLDNEKLDDGNFYSDDEAARWIRTVQAAVGGPARRVFMYCSGSPLGAQAWAATRATGAQALVAWYGVPPLSFGSIGSWPASQIGGHQYTSSGSLGGASSLDLNAFKESAFDYASTAGGASTPILQGDDMPKYQIVAPADNPASKIFIGPGVYLPIPNMTWLTVLSTFAEGANAGADITLTAGQWEIVHAAIDSGSNVPIDYDKLSAAVADHVIAVLPAAPAGGPAPATKQDVIDALKTLTLTAS